MGSLLLVCVFPSSLSSSSICIMPPCSPCAFSNCSFWSKFVSEFFWLTCIVAVNLSLCLSCVFVCVCVCRSVSVCLSPCLCLLGHSIVAHNLFVGICSVCVGYCDFIVCSCRLAFCNNAHLLLLVSGLLYVVSFVFFGCNLSFWYWVIQLGFCRVVVLLNLCYPISLFFLWVTETYIHTHTYIHHTVYIHSFFPVVVKVDGWMFCHVVFCHSIEFPIHFNAFQCIHSGVEESMSQSPLPPPPVTLLPHCFCSLIFTSRGFRGGDNPNHSLLGYGLWDSIWVSLELWKRRRRRRRRRSRRIVGVEFHWILLSLGLDFVHEWEGRGGGFKSNPLRRLCITCGVKGISCSQREKKQRGCKGFAIKNI